MIHTTKISGSTCALQSQCKGCTVNIQLGSKTISKYPKNYLDRNPNNKINIEPTRTTDNFSA